MKSLEEIADFYMTDKRAAEHNYVQYYEYYFSKYRNIPISVLEIGILEHPDKLNRPFGAASLRLWADFFPNAKIHGIDIINLEHLQEERISIYMGDQDNPESIKDIFLQNNLRPQIIIDDGSHRSRHQQLCLAELFQYLLPGGLYIIEDIGEFEVKKNENNNEIIPAQMYPDLNNLPVVFTSKNVDHRFLYNSTFTFLMRYCVTKKIDSYFLNDDESAYLEENIEFCNLHSSNIFNKYIAFIQKR